MSGQENIAEKRKAKTRTAGIHPAWIALMRHCQAMVHGEIERMKIKVGMPVLVDGLHNMDQLNEANEHYEKALF